MTYRRLTNDELAELETAFIRFLALNGITADDWVKIKESDALRTESLIESFSDVVFHETLTKIEYLQIKGPKEIRTFHCGTDNIVLRGLVVDGKTNLDFRKDESPETMISKVQQSGAKLSTYVTEKNYGKEREAELFDMMEAGCLISDGTLFKLLASLSQQS